VDLIQHSLDLNLLDALREQGVPVDQEALERMARHLELVHAYQSQVSLVSQSALERLWEDHVADSLTLTPSLMALHERGFDWWDIGSGGGFPAIPCKAVLPNMPLLCWERSDKKAHALRSILEHTGLLAEVLIADFGRDSVHADHSVVFTARAVEKAERVQAKFAKYMRRDDVFLCQYLAEPRLFPAPMFHVEQVEDGLNRDGWRRGTLHRITRLAEA